jgi:hypothetical protein
MQRLHPFGEHAFFWNLALAAGVTWLVIAYLRPHLDKQNPIVFGASRRAGSTPDK